MESTINARGQVSIPAQLRQEMRLEPGGMVRWERVSETECRMITLPSETMRPDPVGALNFAREHGLEEGSTEEWMRLLRQGNEK